MPVPGPQRPASERGRARRATDRLGGRRGAENVHRRGHLAEARCDHGGVRRELARLDALQEVGALARQAADGVADGSPLFWRWSPWDRWRRRIHDVIILSVCAILRPGLLLPIR